MVLTWLWKMFLWFRQSREAPVLEAPKNRSALGETRADVINDSNDTSNNHVVILEGDEASPSKRSAKG
jgi:hypothetical protein